jgi:SAM-dependent methyltransferase
MDRLEAEVRALREQAESQQRQMNDTLREVIVRVDELGRVFNDKLTAMMERAETIRELGVSILPPPPGEAASTVGTAASDAALTRTCVICSNSVDAWLPFRGGEAGRPIFLKKVQTIGSIRARFWCPHCSSTDRERHLRLFMDRLNIMERVRGGAVLHMSPEPGLGDYIVSQGLRMYVKGDISPSAEGVEQIDLHAIPYADEMFDMVVSNHMLEHVDDAELALREMHRVLKQGGRIICQTPYASRMTRTFEEPLLQSPADRFFFYGQEDHVRLFGSDIEQYFITAGFKGRLVPHSEILPDVDAEQYGVNEREPFFDFIRA